jgi:hypothetical protein
MKRTNSISFSVKSGEPPVASICERRCSLTADAVKSRRKCLMPFIGSSLRRLTNARDLLAGGTST